MRTRCGVDLVDFWRGKITARALWVLIRRLPADSEFKRELDPDTFALTRWGASEYLLADVFDLLAKAHFKPMDAYPRPADLLRKREAERVERLAAEQRPTALQLQAARIRAREEAAA